MNLSFSNTRDKLNRSFWVLSIVLIFSVVLGRFIVAGDINQFILLNDKRIVVEEYNQLVRPSALDYDGQFFYRYALNPFSRDKEYLEGKGDYGILIDDNPGYRRSRILYPLAAWFIGLGHPSLIPYSLVLTNVLSFLIICFGFSVLVRKFKTDKEYIYLSWFLFGTYFATARSLSDTLAIALLLWCYIFFIEKRSLGLLLLTLAALLCRESTAFFLIPIYLAESLRSWKNVSYAKAAAQNLILSIPWMLFVLWKWYISQLYGGTTADFQSNWNVHFGLPFVGIIQSSDTDAFWFKAPYILWTFLLLAICIWKMYKKSNLHGISYFNVWIGLVLSTSFAISIYEDHWSFVRVLAPIHLFAFVFLIEHNLKMPRWMWFISILLFLQTVSFVIQKP